MKKIILQLLLLSIFTTKIFAQSVAINTDGSAANSSSLLDIKSITKGLLIPRMTTVQRTAIASPAKGLIVFDITTNSFWFHNGTAWNVLSSGSSTNYWTASGSDIFNNNAGNVGIGTATPIEKLTVQTTNNSSGISQRGEGGNVISTYMGGTSAGIGTFSPTNMRIFSNGISRMLISEATGNVGIGTDNPTEKLTVQTLNNSFGISHLGEGGNILATKMGGTSAGFGTFSNTNMRIFCNSLSAIFIAEANGNVGIGVADDNPVYKLDIGDRMRIRSGIGTSAGIWLNNPDNSATIAFMGIKDVDVTGIYGNNSGWGLLMNTNTGAVALGYQNPVAGYRLSVLGNQYVDGLIATTGDAEIGGRADVAGNLYVGGSVGINTGTPRAPLDVVGSVVNLFNFYSFVNSASGENGWQSQCVSCSGPISIYASDRVAATEFNAYSDARIKNIIGTTNTTKDLETINDLQITDYTMKDKIQHGSKTYKKVIAQEVEKVYPQVISKHTDFIPNVYQLSNKIEKTSTGYLLSFSNKHNISNTAKKLRVLMQETEGMQEMGIISIPSNTQVEIKAADLKSDKVFVYGEEVDDFRTVDYEGLTTLNISATQELSKLINALNKKITVLEEEIKMMKETKSIVLQTKQ